MSWDWLAEPAAASWLPHLSPQVQAALRIAYAVLVIGTLAHALPHVKRFFLAERWGGYGENTWRVLALQNPVMMPVVLGTWAIAAALLGAGNWTPWTALVTVAISRYYVVSTRRRSLLGGLGAAGLALYWLGTAVLLLELTGTYAPRLQPVALLILQLDLAGLLCAAGLRGLFAGGAHETGMALANPIWGRWWRWYSGLPPAHPVFRVAGRLVPVAALAIGALAIVPSARPAAGLLLFMLAAVIATQVRLSLACPAVMTAAILFAPAPPATTGMVATSGWLALAGLIAYAVLLPSAYVGVRRQAMAGDPAGYMVIHEVYRDGSRPARLISAFPGLRGSAAAAARARRRFSHAAESTAINRVAAIVGDRAGDRADAEARLLQYARTIRCRSAKVLVFDGISIQRGADAFRHLPAARFVVDLARETVVEAGLADPIGARTDATLSLAS